MQVLTQSINTLMNGAPHKVWFKLKKVKLTPKDIRYFNERVRFIDGDGCYEWEGSLDSKGYGRMPAGGFKHVKAHRVAMLIEKGDIEDGLVVAHKCDNPRCVRPSHLMVCTQTDNIKDRNKKGRTATGARSGAVVCPEVRPRGVFQWKHKLTNEDVVVIRNRCASGESHISISKDYGVSHQCIYYVAHRKTWKHVA